MHIIFSDNVQPWLEYNLGYIVSYIDYNIDYIVLNFDCFLSIFLLLDQLTSLKFQLPF